MSKVYYAKRPTFTDGETTIESMKETHIEIPHEFDDEKTLDEIYVLMNDYATNPLSEENGGQEWVCANGLHHTSMSTGDIIERKGKFYECCFIGWRVL